MGCGRGGFHDAEKINVAVLFALGVLLSAPGSAADRSAPSEELPGDAPETDVSVKFHALDYSQSVMNLSQGSSEKRLNDMRGELISLDVEEDTLKHRLRQALRDNLRRQRPWRRQIWRQRAGRA